MAFLQRSRIEGKRADLIARIKNSQGESYILHIEVQNNNRADVPLRMMRYYTDLALEHFGERIEQYLLYIGKSSLTMPDHVQAREWRYCYNVLDMRRLDSDDFLSSENPDALVLAILCDLGDRKPEVVVAHIVSELSRLHGSHLDSLRDSMMTLDILASNRDLQHLVKENSKMLIEIEKLGLYQLGVERGQQQGLEQGKVEGLEQGQQEIVLRLLDKLSPEQVADLSGVSLAKIQTMAAESKS